MKIFKETDKQVGSSGMVDADKAGNDTAENSRTETIVTMTETAEEAETKGFLNVKITLSTDQAWVHTSADVKVKVENLDKKKKLKIKSVQAKIGQNGTWNDITEEMKLTISENCAVYVLVTDADGNTCEKNRYMECFDKEAPTLNAAVNDGLLSVQCQDTQSGVKAVYVNGYKFTRLTDGTLNIRLQKFDAGYQYFTIQAMDNAGNMSEVYKTPNPYYTDPDTEEKTAGTADPKEQLPTNVQATAPTQATAGVTEHTRTDSNGNVMKAQYGSSGSEKSDTSEKTTVSSKKGKEFYTIQTDNEKVFYLVIDRNGEEETVHFLTDVSENDLLNVTQQNNETLPQNSAALESAIPTDAALPNNHDGTILTDGLDVLGEELLGTETESTEVAANEENSGSSHVFYIILAVVGAAAIGAGYYFKVVRKKQDDFEDEDDEDDPDNEEYEDDTDNAGDHTEDTPDAETDLRNGNTDSRSKSKKTQENNEDSRSGSRGKEKNSDSSEKGNRKADGRMMDSGSGGKGAQEKITKSGSVINETEQS